jgi:hypothetical protein
MNDSNKLAEEGKIIYRIIKKSAGVSALCYHSTEKMVVKTGFAACEDYVMVKTKCS